MVFLLLGDVGLVIAEVYLDREEPDERLDLLVRIATLSFVLLFMLHSTTLKNCNHLLD